MEETTVVNESDDEISLIDLVVIVWHKKILIIAITALAAIGSVLYSLTLSNLYSAKATVLPIASSSGSSGLSQYAGLAQMAGISLPGASSSDPVVKIEAILKSRSLAEMIIADLDLVPFFIEKPKEIKPPVTPPGAALEIFQEAVFSVSVDKDSGLISIGAKTKSPELSRDIANKAVALLEIVLNGKAMTVSKKTSRLLELQVAEQDAKVKKLQDTLVEYQKTSRILTPQGQVEQTMTLYSSLIQSKITTEIELSRLESALSADNPKITALHSQLATVNKQISDIEGSTHNLSGGLSLADTPDAMIKYQNIMQELEIATKIYATLLVTAENMKLQEADDQLFVEIIDPAVAPEIKTEPRRSMICVVGTMAGFFIGVLLAFVMNAWASVKDDLKRKLLKPQAPAKAELE